MEIRWAQKDEWSQAMTLVWKTYLSFEASVYGEQGTKEFFEFLTDDRLHEGFEKGSYQVAVAVDDGRIIGVASLRNVHHLSLLFVDADYHRQGVGKSLLDFLCDYLEKEAGERFMSVKAAPPAKGFYEKVGFTSTGPLERYGGISVYPMERVFRPGRKGDGLLSRVFRKES